MVIAGLTSAVAILAAVGFGLAIRSPSASGTGPGLTAGSPAVGSTLATSFGTLRVSEVEHSDGLSSSDLGGMTHGINSLVSAGNTSLTAEFTLVNDTDHPVRVNRDQFTLLRTAASGDRKLAPTGTTLAAGELRAKSSLEAVVSFVVPSDGAPLQLSYRDPGRSGDLVVDLGRTALATPDPDSGSEHSH